MLPKDSVVDCSGTTQKPASTPVRFFLAARACCSGSGISPLSIGDRPSNGERCSAARLPHSCTGDLNVAFPMVTLPLPEITTPPQIMPSPTLTAGLPLMNTVADPSAMEREWVPQPFPQVQVCGAAASPTRAAG